MSERTRVDMEIINLANKKVQYAFGIMTQQIQPNCEQVINGPLLLHQFENSSDEQMNKISILMQVIWSRSIIISYHLLSSHIFKNLNIKMRNYQDLQINQLI